MTRYKRVLIKISGGAVAGARSFGFDAGAMEHIASEVLAAADLGAETAVVIGGGNIFRGHLADLWGIERAEADNIGVMGTVINSLMLRGVLKARGASDVRVMTSIAMKEVAEPYIRQRALRHLERGCLLLLAGGTGQPYVTTDYAAVQRALELNCDAILVAKHGVNGIFSADPKQHPDARRYLSIGYDDVVRENLKVMDQTALLLARDFGMPLHVFDFERQGAMRGICLGENIGTHVSAHAPMVLE